MVDIPTERAISRVAPSVTRPSSPGPAVQVGRSSTGAGLSALAGGLGAAAANLDRVVERQNAEAERSSGFETQRRFLEFAAQQEDTLKQGQQSVQPGAFGYSEQARAGYKESATEFMKTVPDHLKGEYDVKLFGVEDRLVSQATTFEQGARRQHYGASVDDTLTGIEGRLFANPDDYDTILAEGNALIDAIPDEGFSQIEKAELKRGWEDKAKLAVLNGVTPEERIRLLGGVDPNAKTEVPKNIQKGIAGYDPAVSKAIVEESRRAGVNPEAMFVISWLESRGKPGAKNPKSSAGGLFQQIDSNAKAYGVQDRLDPRQSAAGAARFMADNTRKLRKVLGRDPTIGELYLAHQQGGGGASKLLSNPNARAADLVGANAVRLNGGDVDMTASEFAGIWLKKAGDAHVPDGGLLNADFDPDKADSRFANFDYQSAQGAIQGAQRELSAGIADQISSEKAQRELLSAQLGVGVTKGDVGQEGLDAALSGGQITPQRWEALTEQIISQDRAREKKTESFDAAVEKLTAGEALNGLSSDDRAGVNAIDEKLQEAAQGNAEQLTQSRVAMIGQGGVAPQAMVDEILQGINQRDPEAFALAQQVVDANPQAFSGIPKGQGVVDALNRYEVYAGAGLASDEAAQAAVPTEEEKRKSGFVKDAVRGELKQIEVSDVISRFDTFLPGDAPSITPQVSGEIMGDFEILYTQARTDGMSPSDAQLYAEKRLFDPASGLYGVSNLGGGTFKDGRWFGDDLSASKYVMRLPPENFYPPVNGSHDYIKDDIEASLRGLDDFSGGDWFLMADPSETDNAVKAMREGQNTLPGYRLFYADKDGAMQDAYWRIERDQIDETVSSSSAARKVDFDATRKLEIHEQFKTEMKRKGISSTSPEYMSQWMAFKEGADADLR